MSAKPEFSRPLRLDQLGDAEQVIDIEADEAERAAIASRFDLVAVGHLSAHLLCRREAERVDVKGVLRARVTQHCIAGGSPVSSELKEPFQLRFMPENAEELVEEIELEADDCDTISYEGSAVDMGEAVAETLALALDPFPRSPDAEDILRAAGVKSEGEAGPFGALSQLREKLAGGKQE